MDVTAPCGRIDRRRSRRANAGSGFAATIPHFSMQGADEVRDDVRLLDRIIARDAEALGALYDRHSRLLYGLILQILRDRGEAEEILQEVFVQVWRRAETYAAALGTPVAWLVRIARNRAIDQLRANNARTRTLETSTPPRPAIPSPEARAVMTEQQRLVARALDALADDERRLLEDAYFLGFTHSELAKRFSLPLGTVKSRIRNALATLRRALQHTIVETSG
jgi:RNA polymerase sigma-70 factor (ECF subfamily)